MKLILTICLPFIAILFDHCTTCSCKTVPCPAFNDTAFSRWFPYNTSDQIIFQNASASDTFSLYVERSEAYDATQGCIGASGGCLVYCRMNSNEVYASYNRKFQVSIYSSSPKSVSLDFYQFNCLASDIVDTGLVLVDTLSQSHYYPSLNIGGKSFSNVQLLSKDTSGNKNKMAGPYQIFLVKNAGIVAYENYPDLTLWVKQ